MPTVFFFLPDRNVVVHCVDDAVDAAFAYDSSYNWLPDVADLDILIGQRKKISHKNFIKNQFWLMFW